jgi:hypothetical protein
MLARRDAHAARAAVVGEDSGKRTGLLFELAREVVGVKIVGSDIDSAESAAIAFPKETNCSGERTGRSLRIRP